MKKFLFACMCAAMLLFSATTNAQEAAKDTATLTVIVTNVKNNDGSVIIALCNSEENYNSDKREPFDGQKGQIADNQSVIRFEALPLGEYAIKLFHDENDNGEMDTNFLGLPKEGYAFSNNVKGTFGIPKYRKTKFDVTGDMTIEISLSSSDNAE